MTNKDIHRKLNYHTKGPHNILILVYTNGIVRLQREDVSGRINIRRCIPYSEPHQLGGHIMTSSPGNNPLKLNKLNYINSDWFICLHTELLYKPSDRWRAH